MLGMMGPFKAHRGDQRPQRTGRPDVFALAHLYEILEFLQVVFLMDCIKKKVVLFSV